VIEPREVSVFTPASRQILTRAASFTTMSQLPYAGQHTHAFIERLVASRPGYELRLGRDQARVPDAITTLLATKPWTRAVEQDATRESSPPSVRPLVSVVIPTFNGARFIADGVKNVLAQDYPALEIIIVDDGSLDDTAEAVARLPVDVRYLRQANAGASSARNRGIRDTSGEFVAFLDVDDQWPVGNLERLVDHMAAHPELDVVHGYAQILRLDPRTERYEFEGNPRESFPFYIGAGLYRRHVFERVGLFDTELKFAEDTDWYQRAEEFGCQVEALEEVTLHVRRHDQNMTRDKSLVELNVLRVLKRSLDRRRGLAAESASAE